MLNRMLSSACAGALVLATTSSSMLDAKPAKPAAAKTATVDWASIGRSTDESGYSPLDSIRRETVGRLGLAWSLDLEGEAMLEATPLAVGGTLYFTGSYADVYAVDGRTGKLLWKYDPQVRKYGLHALKRLFSVNRGAAYDNGRVFAASLDGRLFALDAKTGKLLWIKRTVDANSLYTSAGAPRVFNGKVIIGNGGGDFGARGYVTAYDQKTGKQAWRFYTVPGTPAQNKGDPAMERAAKTWSGEYWKTGTGGTVWNGMTFDPELNRIYIGTGNSGPYDPEVRSPGGGDNLYLASIVALDADSGKYVWHYQVNPREAWDWKATMNIVAATLTIDGKPRKVLMQSPTNGFFYVLDRLTGKLISAEKTGKVTWASHIDLKTGRPVEAPNIRYESGEATLWPSMLGTHNWQAMSYSPKSGLVYIPYMQMGVKFSKKLDPSMVSLGGLSFTLHQEDDKDGKGALLAWDPVAQKERWRLWHDHMWNGGTMATGGNLVFQGTAEGWFSAYDALNGDRLWRFNAGLGIIAAPMTWSVNGRQYVSVLVGYGLNGGSLFHVGWKYGAQKRRLLTFALDGKAVLPPTPPADMRVMALDDPALVLDQADVDAGSMLFAAHCMMCHGATAVSAGAPGPDLRESPVALNRDSLWAVVHDGVLLERNMPRFDELSQAQVKQIHAYIRARAREALSLRKDAAGQPAATRN